MNKISGGMAPTSDKSAKYKKQKLSSDVLAEILRSDDEDELVEFINNSFAKNGPAVASSSKKRSKASNKGHEDDSMHEIDLSSNGLTHTTSGTNYDLSNNGESIIVGDKPRSARFRTCVAFGLFVSFFALGIGVAILGPSLLDLKDLVHVSFQAMSTVFTIRSIGYLLGSIIAGWLLDRWNAYFILAISCFVASVSLIVTPLTKSYLVLLMCIVCQGLALGSLDTGGNVLILNLYGKSSDAQMQALHAMFGLGAFVAPLLVRPFLSTHTPATLEDITNSSLEYNHTVPSVILSNLTTNQTRSHPSVDTHSSLKWPFGIPVLFFVIPIMIFTVAGFKESGRNQQGSKTWENVSGSDRRAFRGFSLVLLFIFMMLYVGMEVAIGGLIFSFSFKHGILKTKSLAAYLTSTFWGSFCVGRFLGIPMAIYVRAYIILVLDMLGCLIGTIILAFLTTTAQAWLWVGTSFLGLSMASVFPSTMTWVDTFMHITGKSASILVVGASLGEMTIPLTIGTLMERKGADVFLHSLLVIVIMAVLIFVIVSVLARRQQKEDINIFGIHYRKSTEQKTNHTVFSKSDEIVQLLEDSSEIFSLEN